MESLTLRCTIEQIADWHSHLFLEPHIVACVAILSQYSQSPAVLAVECTNIVSSWLGQEERFKLEISWSEDMAKKADRFRATMQSKSLTEMAAIALSLILTHHIVNLGQLDVTNYGDRADYRSLNVPSVLEISGTETPSEFTRRHREKVAQALENPFGLDAYVVVCSFSEDNHRIRFSYHRQQHDVEE